MRSSSSSFARVAGHVARLAVLVVASACGRAAAPPATPAPSAASAAVEAPVVAPLATSAPSLPAGELRDVRVWSPSLGVTKRYRVWLPPRYASDATSRYPVAFYLHGLYGDETNWTQQGKLATTLDSMSRAGMPPMIVVMPDGDDSWYVTSNVLVTDAQCRRVERKEPADQYCVAWWRYDEYIARDLVAHVDSAYRTRADRAHRAIAGLSMGGYGAVTLALRYPDVFSAAASHSGVLSPMYDGPSPFAAPPRYLASPDAVRERWSRFWPSMGFAFGRDTASWWARDPTRMMRRVRESGGTLPALWFDAGRDDELVIDENRAFDWELTSMGIAHEWHERAGRHDWTFWSTNAPLSLAWIASHVANDK